MDAARVGDGGLELGIIRQEHDVGPLGVCRIAEKLGGELRANAGRVAQGDGDPRPSSLWVSMHSSQFSVANTRRAADLGA